MGISCSEFHVGVLQLMLMCTVITMAGNQTNHRPSLSLHTSEAWRYRMRQDSKSCHANGSMGVQEEHYLLDTIKMAVGAPLPTEWHEDRSGTKFVHESGAISNNHPLDVYFLETIRMRRDEKARLEREGRAAIEQAQKASVKRILEAMGDNHKILSLKRGATRKDVRDSYRALALQVHPDKNPQAGAAEAFHVLNAAFRECMDMSAATWR
mmetsp:Transcript_19486/g.54217  ORF Transcript_19486/g.54217 Transcript_19486/m.54217 type:complete len:210 (+) Transcript_19486:1409-2038(+)